MDVSMEMYMNGEGGGGAFWGIGFFGRLILDIFGFCVPLMFPKVPQSSQTESLGFPRNTLPETNIAPENWWLGDKPFLLRGPIFRCVCC